MRFGQSVDEYQKNFQPRWLTTFKAGETRLRPLHELAEWWTFREHYHPTLKSFPCTESEECLGCSWTHDERMGAPTRRYAASMVDKDKRARVFKITQGVFRDFRQLSAQTQTITDRDWTVTRYEENGRTNYRLDRADVYAVPDLPPAVEESVFNKILEDAYREAMDKAVELTGVYEESTEVSDGEESVSFAEMSVKELKEILDSNGVTYGKGMSKDALIAVANEYLGAPNGVQVG